MAGIKGLTGIYKRKPRFNKFIDCGDYIEIIIEDRFKKEKCRAIIDKVDLKKVQTGKWSHAISVGYAMRIIKNKTVLLHQVILGKKKGFQTDHINGDRLDNRKSNLRFVTPQQNVMNRKSKGIYLSTHFKKQGKEKWVSHIFANGKFHYLGLFEDKEDAIKARENAEIKYFKEFRRI